MSAPISEHISAPTGKSEDPAEDVCANCNHEMTKHEDTWFEQMNEDGEMQGTRIKGGYCWICLKVCWDKLA